MPPTQGFYSQPWEGKLIDNQWNGLGLPVCVVGGEASPPLWLICKCQDPQWPQCHGPGWGGEHQNTSPSFSCTGGVTECTGQTSRSAPPIFFADCHSDCKPSTWNIFWSDRYCILCEVVTLFVQVIETPPICFFLSVKFTNPLTPNPTTTTIKKFAHLCISPFKT